ncbi:MAG TPA: tellurium resistance protein TerC [Firmicutes bacterium]|jgi:tellurite resistance protein TerC|nr:tellurium resistance protein TerC [Bacillota bacterium]
MSIKRALLWVAFWTGMALLFCMGIYFWPAKEIATLFHIGTYSWNGKEYALQFLGGYIIEQSLSVDNLFLFLLIFSSFKIPASFQRRILNYGIIGAVILRLIFIVVGVAAVRRFHWILYIFGVLLIYSGIKMFVKEEKTPDFNADHFIFRLLGKVIPVSATLTDEKFFVRKNRLLYATPLLAILILIECSDILFAIDSIPAIFSITTNAFIVYTSNIFAILGLRSLYFVLERLHNAFRYVKYGVALILVFTGVKLAVLYFKIEISLGLSIAIIFATLVLSILVSVLLPQREL